MTGPFVLSGTIFQGTEIEMSFHRQGCWGRSLDDIKEPTRQVLIVEIGWNWLNEQESAVWEDNRQFPHDEDEPGNTGEPRLNMTFVDGHGKFIKARRNEGNGEHYSNKEYDFSAP